MGMVITSFNNPKIKAIRKLEDRKYRALTGDFFVEGLRIVGEAIQAGAAIKSILVAPELLVSNFGNSLLSHPSINQIELIQVSPEVFKSISHREGPQGIGAVVEQSWWSLDSLGCNPTDFWIAIDQASDPGNLGTIMRTADAVGARGVILIGSSTDPHDPAAVKASLGSIFSLQIVRTNWASFQTWQVENQISLIGTSDHAEIDYQSIDYQLPLVLLMGSERHGLPDEMITACQHVVKIPMSGRADSLNLGVAAAIVLYEIFNQYRKLDTIKL